MTESGFVKEQSGNLPEIGVFMMTTYFANNSDFTSAELRSVKAASSQHWNPSQWCHISLDLSYTCALDDFSVSGGMRAEAWSRVDHKEKDPLSDMALKKTSITPTPSKEP
ncbi:hypothetical protein EVAR_55811_1 [Eumeta japonica]|uniref:Uncharacterized protein n=1 Tax=Eumeta variegata TaxID=151549 RepID=A0A4C1ZCY5_EUMVA|nr:hypothetical protein EVAR_55811_1 [Eumeta japonica]